MQKTGFIHNRTHYLLYQLDFVALKVLDFKTYVFVQHVDDDECDVVMSTASLLFFQAQT